MTVSIFFVIACLWLLQCSVAHDTGVADATTLRRLLQVPLAVPATVNNQAQPTPFPVIEINGIQYYLVQLPGAKSTHQPTTSMPTDFPGAQPTVQPTLSPVTTTTRMPTGPPTTTTAQPQTTNVPVPQSTTTAGPAEPVPPGGWGQYIAVTTTGANPAIAQTTSVPKFVPIDIVAGPALPVLVVPLSGLPLPATPVTPATPELPGLNTFQGTLPAAVATTTTIPATTTTTSTTTTTTTTTAPTTTKSVLFANEIDASKLVCEQDMCANRVVNAQPSNAWQFECKSDCQGMTLNLDISTDPLNVPNLVSSIDKLRFKAAFSAQGAVINMINSNGVLPVSLGYLECLEEDACLGLTVVVGPGIDLQSTFVQCSKPRACEGCTVVQNGQTFACEQLNALNFVPATVPFGSQLQFPAVIQPLWI